MLNKDHITFDEFKAWLNGLIMGKNGTLPDTEDWKVIKQMMDKVVADKEYITEPYPYPIPMRPLPPIRPYEEPWTTPEAPIWNDGTGWDPFKKGGPQIQHTTCNANKSIN